MNRRLHNRTAEVEIAFAADALGSGVAYARIGDLAGTVVRVPFAVKRLAGCEGREIPFAAIAAIVNALRARGYASLRLAVPDDEAVADACSERPIPPALAMPYVALRCAINEMRSVEFVALAPDAVAELDSRARAEVAMRIAA